MHVDMTSVLLQLPGYVLWKDCDSKYLGCNEAFLTLTPFVNKTKLIGVSDFEMPWGDTHAQKFIRDDLQVVTTGKPLMQYIETNYRFGQWYSVYVSKFPLRENGVIIGVICHFYDLKPLNDGQKQIKLTVQQKKCLALCLEGYSAKEIAKTMACSPRTIETYLEHLKAKFSCKNKTELIRKAILLGF